MATTVAKLVSRYTQYFDTFYDKYRGRNFQYRLTIFHPVTVEKFTYLVKQALSYDVILHHVMFRSILYILNTKCSWYM